VLILNDSYGRTVLPVGPVQQARPKA